jgi:hypothetical protein
MHALVPLTEQEERVEEILLQYEVTHLTHVPFPVGDRQYVVDFFLPNNQIAIECWQSTSRRGVALTWMEKNAAYIDWKFRRIKGVKPAVRCVALVEVAQAGAELVEKYVGPVMEHADSVCYSKEDFAKMVMGWRWTNEGDSRRVF